MTNVIFQVFEFDSKYFADYIGKWHIRGYAGYVN